MTRGRRLTCALAGASVLTSAALTCAALSGCAGSAAAPAPAPPQRVAVSPYVDMTLDDVPDLVQAARRGARTLNLGFVTAADGACRPAWGGTAPYDDPEITGRIRGLREAGGEARVSFGGESGEELALACRTPSDLAAAYAQVIDALGVSLVDLDVEGPALGDGDAVHRRNLALRLLQDGRRRSGQPIRLSYTLPAEEGGLSPTAQALLRDARGSGVEVDVVNAMTMDMSVGAATDTGTDVDKGGRAADLAGATSAAAEGTERFVRSLWPERAAGGAAWGLVAVTLMIGRNDLPSEVLHLQDARSVAAFARRRGLAWLAFWSLNRDRPCAAGEAPDSGGAASPACSGVQQRPGDFLAAFT